MYEQTTLFNQNSLPEASPAKTCLSLENVRAFRDHDPGSGGSSTASLVSSEIPNGVLSKTCLAYYPVTKEEILPSYFDRWQTSGFSTAESRGGFWTLHTSTCPRDVKGFSSSLQEILLEDVPPKYSLSQRAAKGILERSNRRGYSLPTTFQKALESIL